MGKGYLSYLIFISLLFSVLSFLIYIFFRRKKNKNVYSERITFGSLSIFFDKNKSAVIIPYVTEKDGTGKAMDKIRNLWFPYKAEKLGIEIRGSMLQCVSGSSCSNDTLLNILKVYSWKDFTEGKRNVSVCYKKGSGIVLNSTRRTPDGGYQFNKFGYDTVLSETAGDKEIGEAVWKILGYCR